MNPSPGTAPAALDIGQLYQRHGAMVLRRVQRFYRDPVEAQDVLQEVFLRAMEKLHTFHGLASPST
jgi:DNA-directed RNA polymerase specialized sigma24 family protein